MASHGDRSPIERTVRLIASCDIGSPFRKSPPRRFRSLWPRPSVAAAVGLEIAAPDQPIDHLVGNLNRPEKQSEPAPAADLFNQKVEGTAWKMKPSWYVLATKDRTVHPELQRFVAKRMGATIVEVASSHVPMLSNAALVLDVIRKAAAAVQNA
ncbi:MAG TPA: alpha/beta fold hydrolase [Xanthobacteraceae bacterium]|nr:alpha/beta fold hydrolase [Xanthobacteraceae bacterium]